MSELYGLKVSNTKELAVFHKLAVLNTASKSEQWCARAVTPPRFLQLDRSASVKALETAGTSTHIKVAANARVATSPRGRCT